MNKTERHLQICETLNEIYTAKNAAYGDSFGKTYRELGHMSAVVRMSDKWNRIVNLSKGAENTVNDENLADTLLDLANYCIMTLIEMEELANDGSR